MKILCFTETFLLSDDQRTERALLLALLIQFTKQKGKISKLYFGTKSENTVKSNSCFRLYIVMANILLRYLATILVIAFKSF